MIDRYTPPEPDERLEELDAQLIRLHAPGREASHVAGRVFEASRHHLNHSSDSSTPHLRLVDEDGPSMLPRRSWSAWPIMATMAAMVVVATLIAILYSVQMARNNYVDPTGDQVASGTDSTTAESVEYSDVDDEFESAFNVASSTLMSDISASVDSLVTSSDEWAYGSLSSELQSATSSLWEDMNSF